MRFARFVLLAQALLMLGFSLAYWLRPYEMANLNGVLLMESASISHMRVYYGGMQLGLALFLLWAMRAPERARAALAMLLISMLTLVAARLLALWIDGGELTGFDLASMFHQLLAGVLAGVAYWTLRQPEVEEPQSIPPPARQIDLACTPPQPFRVADEAQGVGGDGAPDLTRPPGHSA